jgi:retron-type reverse transcriptase
VQGKSYDISKRLIWAAWLKVKGNGGAAGADGVTIGQFEQDVKNNLYRLWNRMSSGSYFPGPVRAVEIPKKGGTRVLGIPNVIDRVAQTAAVLLMEPGVERVFHNDSYGYRPGRSPADAVRVCGNGVSRGTGTWMAREFPALRFERFADDVVVHCVTERQAHLVRQAIGRRFADIGLQLHPDKTRIVYCKDDRRRLDFDQVTFTFCGYAFRPRETFVRGRRRKGSCLR